MPHAIPQTHSAFYPHRLAMHASSLERPGLGPRNDVLTTCKAVTQRGGQRIITVFFPQQIFLDFLQARHETAEEIRNA